jgi:aryl-alcohol dehydrogenase-like predicted oxidoreductase
MEHRRLGASGLRVSELCLGTMTFGREADEPTSLAMLDRFLDAGGDFVDTANVYAAGASEEIIGRALAGRRDKVVIATKYRFPTGRGANDQGTSRRHVMLAVEDSLRRLQTDWIDLYQIHLFDPDTPLEESLGALDDLVRAGKVRYVGASNFAAWQLMKALGVSAAHHWARFVSYQPEYSLVRRDIEREHVALCRSEGVGIIPWGPLGGGIVTGKYTVGAEPPADTRGGDTVHPAAQYLRSRITERNAAIAAEVAAVGREIGRTPAQVGLNWVLHRPGITAPLIGARTPEQLDDNLGAHGWRLDPGLVSRLDAASAPLDA